MFLELEVELRGEFQTRSAETLKNDVFAIMFGYLEGMMP